MPLDSKLKLRLERVLNTVDDHGSFGPRLTGDAVRLSNRLRRFADLALVPAETDWDSLELACYALQLPPRQDRGAISGKLGRTNLRERCEQAAELLVSLVGADVEEKLLDRTTRLIHEIPQRAPMIDEARLLADALNLDDFGVTGLFIMSMQMAVQGDGVIELSAASEKREQYGYWEARLKDGFHHEPIRQIAQRRLDNARQVARFLTDELREDKS
jgi:hypothetical protein